MLLALWSAYFETSGPTPPPDVLTAGGFGDHKKYREYLERLNGITAKSQITPEVIEAAEAITEIPIAAKQIAKIAYQKKDIDFTKIQMEMVRIQDYLNKMELMARQLRERDDEIALLLLI